MSITSIMSPMSALSVGYPSDGTIDTFMNIAVQNIYAPEAVGGVAQDLTLSASSRIVMESSGNAELYIKDNNSFLVYQSKFDTFGNRTDTSLLDMHSNAAPSGGLTATVLDTGMDGNAMWVYGADSKKTTWISMTQFRSFNSYEQLATTESNGFLINNQTTFSSNVVIDQDVYMKSTMEVDGNATFYGNLFSQNMNLWHDNIEKNCRVGFGFCINDMSQLELVKYASFSNGTKMTKKVAVFGNSPMLPNEQTDGNSYLVFDELSGIGIHTPGSAASNSSMPANPTMSLFRFTADGNITTSAQLGIGIENPQYPLDVLGTIHSTAVLAQDISAQTITTTSDERLKDIRGTVDTLSCLEKIKQLDIIDFAYIKDMKPEGCCTQYKAGLRAQQVMSVMEDAVITKEFAGLDDCHLIDSSVMLAYLVGAIKELASRFIS